MSHDHCRQTGRSVSFRLRASGLHQAASRRVSLLHFSIARFLTAVAIYLLAANVSLAPAAAQVAVSGQGFLPYCEARNGKFLAYYPRGTPGKNAFVCA
jgi:hypothetical protein